MSDYTDGFDKGVKDERMDVVRYLGWHSEEHNQEIYHPYFIDDTGSGNHWTRGFSVRCGKEVSSEYREGYLEGRREELLSIIMYVYGPQVDSLIHCEDFADLLIEGTHLDPRLQKDPPQSVTDSFNQFFEQEMK